MATWLLDIKSELMNVMSQRGATACGLAAIMVWSTASALLRSVSEYFGPIGGAALIYTLGTLFLVLFLGLPRFKSVSKSYIVVAAVLFVLFEICFSLALGYAATREQFMQVSIVIYLWPSLAVFLAILMNGQRARWSLVPGAVLALYGIGSVVSSDGGSMVGLLSNIKSNSLSFALALGCAVMFALYCNVTRRYSSGENLIVLFFLLTAIMLWVKYALSTEVLPPFTWRSSLTLLASALSMALGYGLWNVAVMRGDFTLLTTTSYFGPVFSSVFSSLWLGVHLPLQFWQGALLVTLGSLICWHATRLKPMIGKINEEKSASKCG